MSTSSVLAGFPALPAYQEITPAYAASAIPDVTPNENMPVTDGEVMAIATAPDGTAYIGGNFSYVGPRTGSAVPINASTGQLPANFPEVNGSVFAVTPDGSGGWYIGGWFTSVGGQPRNNLAAIDADGNVTGWNPGADSYVFALTRIGSTVYLGGSFYTVGGQTRYNLAAVDVSGNVTGWNPGAYNLGFPGAVYALASSGSIIYIGGRFDYVGEEPRSRLAAVDTSGNVTGWNPNVKKDDFDWSTIRALIISGSTVYAGGSFNEVGGVTRNGLAAIDTSGNVTGWNPSATKGDDWKDSWIEALAVSGSTIYTGGDFSAVGGQARSNLAAIDTSGNVTSWNPGANNRVFTLAADGSDIYAGGEFTSIGGQVRSRLAAVGTGGSISSWNPGANGAVRVLAASGSTIYAGGQFGSVGAGENPRNNLAAIDPDGNVAGWNPDANDTVKALTLNGSTLYVGGEFTSIGGQNRNKIAAIGTSGAISAWNPGADDTVNAIAVSGSTVYAGGNFTSIGDQTRERLAAINTSGTITSWNPGANDFVNAITISGSTVYIGGRFTEIASQSRDGLAAITTTGTLTGWAPRIKHGLYGIGSVYALAIKGSTIYVGGFFSTLNNGTTYRLAAIDASGTVLNWKPGASDAVYALAIGGSNIYAGGNFSSVKGQSRSNVAGIHESSDLNGWNPDLKEPIDYGSKGSVYALAISGSSIYVGGHFTAIGNDLYKGFARFDNLDTTPPTGTIKINNGVTYTKSANVTLNLTADDPENSVSKMRFSNNNINWTPWEDYTSTKPYTLMVGNGTKRVYVQFKDDAGNISTYSDTIVLDTTFPTGSIKIKNGATYAKSTKVTLNLLASDTGGSGLSQMRFRNYGYGWSSWQSYSTTKSWTLPASNGHKRVDVQFKDGAGNVSSYFDYILLDFTPPTGSIKINSNASYTRSRSVTLDVPARDTGGSGLYRMRFRNYGSSIWSSWQNYTSLKSWTLTAGKGTKRVFTQFRDRAGNISKTYSDTITLK